MKHLRHTILTTLFAVAGLCLLAAGSVSCEHTPVAVAEAEPSADSLALVEGLRLFEDGNFDLARDQLLVSARSDDGYIRAESFLYLNALEMELGNYDAARPYLERYHAETMRLLRGAADAERRMTERTTRIEGRHNLLIGGVIGAGLIVIGVLVFLARRHSSSGPEDEQKARPVDLSPWKPYLIDAEVFKQTPVYAEITELALQSSGRSARVLSLARQEVLDTELGVVFAEFADHLRTDFPSLTAGDVKLCCLSLLPLSSFARALCFGSTETNIIKQRKHQIKKKMTPEVFEFIFSQQKSPA